MKASHFQIAAIVFCLCLWIIRPLQASESLLDFCLRPYQPILVQAYGTEGDVFFGAYTGVNGELIQVYMLVSTGAVLQFFVDGVLHPCAFPSDQGNLPSITLYPLGGTRWTWAVEDKYGHWHPVRDNGVIVVTPPEYDDQGRLITRLVINRNEPTDPSRWHIFDELGEIAG